MRIDKKTIIISNFLLVIIIIYKISFLLYNYLRREQLCLEIMSNIIQLNID